MTTIEDYDHLIIKMAFERKTGIRLPCGNEKQMRSKIVRLNRWRKQMLDVRPELAYMRFCPRRDDRGPYVLVEYDNTYDMEIYDGDGNPLGMTLADLAREEYDRMEEEEREQAKAEEEAVPESERDVFFRKIGLTEEEAVEEVGRMDITDNQRKALDEAERQKGRPLTEEETEAILHSTKDDNLGDDLGL